MRKDQPLLALLLPISAVIFLTFYYLPILNTFFPPAGDFFPLFHHTTTSVRQDLDATEVLRSNSHRPLPPEAVLLLEWKVLLLLPQQETPPDGPHTCLFHNGATSLARPANTNATAFICTLPKKVRRLPRLYAPSLRTRFSTADNRRPTPLLHWINLVFKSLSTPHDIIIFSKGINHHQRNNRPASDLRCIFLINGTTIATTNVTSSAQEVFRCPHPAALVATNGQRIKVSLENKDTGVLPSLATYNPNPPLEEAKSQICAATMVFNSAKFLREWVMYHAAIGVERFILYDNGSEDGLETEVSQLISDGYNVKVQYWPWPKTQEAGFSHAAAAYKNSCEWMAFFDVDEFVISPGWTNSSQPNQTMFSSLLPADPRFGQIKLNCFEFGPSGMKTHPRSGVTQGYTCRNLKEKRHKSVLRLEAVDESLLNVVHHFNLSKGWETKKVPKWEGVVNHYKHQAWPEFKNKFRRRGSAYVPDWKSNNDMSSQDRVVGLGNKAVEPEGWEGSFCEVSDITMKEVTRRWFGRGEDGEGKMKMAWEL